MQYKEVDFQGMMFNVFPLPMSTDLFEAFPALASYEEFYGICPGLQKANVFRYIFYVYDKQSPLTKFFGDNILKRKYEGALLAGFKLNENKRFSDHIEAMIKCEYSEVNRMIIRFLRMQGDHDFSYLSALVDGFYMELPNIQGGDVRNSEKVDKMKKRIEELQKSLTNNDNTKRLIVDIYKFIDDEQKIPYRPESIALKMSKGESSTVAVW